MFGSVGRGPSCLRPLQRLVRWNSSSHGEDELSEAFSNYGRGVRAVCTQRQHPPQIGVIQDEDHLLFGDPMLAYRVPSGGSCPGTGRQKREQSAPMALQI